MRILLDHNTPAPLRYWLIGHEVETAYQRGWAEMSNGDLLRIAEESGFDILITTDNGMRYRQNHAGRRTRIRMSKSVVLEATSDVAPGSFQPIEIPFD